MLPDSPLHFTRAVRFIKSTDKRDPDRNNPIIFYSHREQGTQIPPLEGEEKPAPILSFFDSQGFEHIDIEFAKLHNTTQTLKSGHRVHVKIGPDKSNELSSQTGSPYRSVLPIEIIPYGPTGYIIQTNIQNIHSVAQSATGYGKKSNYKDINPDSEEKIQNFMKKVSSVTPEEWNNKYSEVIIKTITPDMVKSFFLSSNSCANSNRTYEISLKGKIEVYLMQEKWKYYSGKVLPIINLQTGEEIKTEDLEKDIAESFKNYKKSSAVSEELGLVYKLVLAAQSKQLFDAIKRETNNFTSKIDVANMGIFGDEGEYEFLKTENTLKNFIISETYSGSLGLNAPLKNNEKQYPEKNVPFSLEERWKIILNTCNAYAELAEKYRNSAKERGLITENKDNDLLNTENLNNTTVESKINLQNVQNQEPTESKLNSTLTDTEKTEKEKANTSSLNISIRSKTDTNESSVPVPGK